MGRTMLGELEHMLLVAIIRMGEEAYGASVIEEIERRTGRELSYAACYIAIRRLEEKGLISSREADPDPERGGRPRKYLDLTELGRERLAESAGALFSLWHGVDALDPGSAEG